jgi:hypothetical protein
LGKQPAFPRQRARRRLEPEFGETESFSEEDAPVELDDDAVELIDEIEGESGDAGNRESDVYKKRISAL